MGPIMLVLIWQTPFLFLKIQKIIKMLKTWTMSIESFITGRNRKKPRNKKRNETIKIENIRKNVKFLEKENKAHLLLYWHFWFTPLISMLCVKNKKDHIKMSKRGQSRFSHDKFIKEGRKNKMGINK